LNSLQINNTEIQELNLDVVEALYCGNSTVALSPHSKVIYYGIGRQFNNFLAEKNINLSPIAIQQFLMSRPWEPSTRNLKLNALVKIIANQYSVRGNPVLVAAIREAIKQNVFRTKIDKAVRKGDYLTDKDFDDLVSKCQKEKTSFIMEFLFVTGCRISEMINIRLSDIKISRDRSAHIAIIGKGNKQRVVYTMKILIDEIKNVFNSQNYLFDNNKHKPLDRKNLWKDMKKVGIETGYEFIHPHIFRHSTAMKLKEEGMTPDYVKEYLGHNSVKTTLEYYYHSKVESNVVKLF